MLSENTPQVFVGITVNLRITLLHSVLQNDRSLSEGNYILVAPANISLIIVVLNRLVSGGCDNTVSDNT